jgi:ATP-binding cassette, subfamily F, member 3
MLQGQKLIYQAGNYDSYMQTEEENKLQRSKQRDTLDKKKDRIEKSIQEGLSQAKKSSF